MYIIQYFPRTSQVGSLPYEQDQHLLKNYHMHGAVIAPSPRHLKIFPVLKIKLLRDGEEKLCTTHPAYTLNSVSCCKVQDVVLGKGLNPI